MVAGDFPARDSGPASAMDTGPGSHDVLGERYGASIAAVSWKFSRDVPS